MTKFNPEYSIRKEDYMKNKDEDIEEMLLSQASLDDLIKMKIEAEFKDEMQRAKELEAQRQPRVYTKISEAPKEYIFSKYAVYKFYNRRTKLETYINGLQAEALLGLQNNIRNKILNGEMSTFSTDDAYIKFEKVCVNL